MLIFVPLSLRNQALSNLDSKYVGQLIQSYAHSKQLNNGKQLHAQLLRSEYPLTTFVVNHLINLYSKCGAIEYARNLFDEMPRRNTVSWASMIAGFSQNSKHSEAVRAFSLMRVAENPVGFAFASAVKACGSLGSVLVGKQLHCLALKYGLAREVFVGSCLADMYSEFGIMVDFCKVFEEIPRKDLVIWTEMINGYSKNGDFAMALVAFKKMNGEGILIDSHVLSSVLSACAAMEDIKSGKCVHSCLVKLGFESYIVIGNALIDVYSKSDDMENKALMFFNDLRRKGVDPTEYTLSSLVKACANRASLRLGVQVHGIAVKLSFDAHPYISSGLIDVYRKCGLLDCSTRVFYEMRNPRKLAWNSMMNMLVEHGLGQQAAELFEKMIMEVQPNSVTFVNLLLGCIKAGLVEEGLKYFQSMKKIYGVPPKDEHYGYVIDLLSRAGRLNEAEELIKSMPFEPNTFGLCSFIRFCKIHGEAERGKFAAEKVIRLEPNNNTALALLSDLYKKEGNWKQVKIIRKRRREQIVQKSHD